MDVAGCIVTVAFAFDAVAVTVGTVLPAIELIDF